ncbi:hypothetical protein ZMO1_ZMOp32x032 (plasmid) [Zymomonas mobilis subsp. mobilis ZM4 = ATCC 31821]|nr:hypothetical protein ZMO1_ZMOp32x032 [Zymomonas mobilis subsp. mobilis ZM4 = ATCC 31821]
MWIDRLLGHEATHKSQRTTNLPDQYFNRQPQANRRGHKLPGNSLQKDTILKGSQQCQMATQGSSTAGKREKPPPCPPKEQKNKVSFNDR